MRFHFMDYLCSRHIAKLLLLYYITHPIEFIHFYLLNYCCVSFSLFSLHVHFIQIRFVYYCLAYFSWRKVFRFFFHSCRNFTKENCLKLKDVKQMSELGVGLQFKARISTLYCLWLVSVEFSFVWALQFNGKPSHHMSKTFFLHLLVT